MTFCSEEIAALQKENMAFEQMIKMLEMRVDNFMEQRPKNTEQDLKHLNDILKKNNTKVELQKKKRRQLEMCIQSKNAIVKKEDDLKSQINVVGKNIKSLEQHKHHLNNKNKLQRNELKQIHRSVGY